jgi:hypothetical protein
MAVLLGGICLLSSVIAIPAGLFAAGMFFYWYRESSEPEAEALKKWELALALKSTAISIGSWVIGRIALYVLAGR